MTEVYLERILDNIFTGTQLVVAGSQLVPVDLNSFGGTCTVDGVTQPIIYTTHNATNRVALCRYENLTDSHHTLVLDAVPAGRKPFWFDYLRYLPTPDVSTTNEYVEVLTDNDSIFFDDSWHNQAPENVIQASTNTTNAVMSYTFVGKPLSILFCTGHYAQVNHQARQLRGSGLITTAPSFTLQI